MTNVPRWTGIEVRRLRKALRMTLLQFAAHLGVSESAVTKWENSGAHGVPRPLNQSALDDALNRCTPEQLIRFERPDDEDHTHPNRIDLVRWGLVVNVDRSDLDLIRDIIAAVNTVIAQHTPPPHPHTHHS